MHTLLFRLLNLRLGHSIMGCCWPTHNLEHALFIAHYCIVEIKWEHNGEHNVINHGYLCITRACVRGENSTCTKF